jgi:hypothetical protein
VPGCAVGTGAVGAAVAEALGAGDADGGDAGDESVGEGLALGLGLGDEPMQKMIRTQVWDGAGWSDWAGWSDCASWADWAAATARPPPNPMTPAVNSSEARASTARRFMPAPSRSPCPAAPRTP